MLIVRVFAAALKPALVGAAITASAAGGVAAWQYTHNDVTPFQQAQSAGLRLLVSEFGEDGDTIAAIDPDNPSDRSELARIEHAPGYGIFATLSPDGEAIAYTALPADSVKPAPDQPAVAAIVEADGDVISLADDVDLLIAPVWSPDGESIVVRKNSAIENSAGRFELILLGRDGSRSTITAWNSAAVFPIAFSTDGTQLYFATLNADGADLYSVAPDGADETRIAHLSDDIARDWRLSPDGATLAYSVLENGSEPRVKTMLLDLASGEASEAREASAVSEYNPTWRADGELTIASIDADGRDALATGAAGNTTTISGTRAGITVPLRWAPDGSTLAALSIDGQTPLDVGAGHLEVVTPEGERTRISEGPDVLIVGWLE
jgi:Tol biopolymer transport system component